MKVLEMEKRKFGQLCKLAKVILTIAHNNAKRNHCFRVLKKKLTQRASVSLDGTLSSVITFQLNRTQGKTGYKYKPLKPKKLHWSITKNIVRITQQNDIKTSTKYVLK